MSGVHPQSTTAGLAGGVEKESSRGLGSSALPGMFPETPSNEASDFSVNPIPATSGTGNPVSLQPGEKVPDAGTLTSNTTSSTVSDDMSLAKSAGDSEQTFGVAPIPASAGMGNPVRLLPGEKVPDPSTFTSNTVKSTATTDKESYENSSGAPQLPGVVTPQHERDARGGGMFSLPERSGNMIPESSLPMGGGGPSERDPGVHIQSAAPQSTTAQLAGNVPLEPRAVPEMVRQSQAEAGFDSEASGNREAVREKGELEKELESKVPEEPSTAEGTSTEGGGATDKKEFSGAEIAGIAAGGGAAGGAVAAATGYNLPASITQSIEQMNRGTTGSFSTVPSAVQETSYQHSGAAEMGKGVAMAPTVPDIVQESIAESHQAPEAAASEEVVGEKSVVEQELLRNVKTEDAAGEPAPSASAALSDSAPTTKTTTTALPEDRSGLAAPASAPATTPAASNAFKQAVRPREDSREVSPMTRGPTTTAQTQPMVTSGVGSSAAPKVSQTASGPATPQKAATPPKSSLMSGKNGESSAGGNTDKKSRRGSGFFGKLKAKFSDKDKDKK